jgi:hypothetical protein
MKILVNCFFFIVLFKLSSAQVINQTIVAAELRNPIGYATVTYKVNTKVGTYSDLAGKFSIPKIEDDSLIVSYVGYKTRYLSMNELANTDTIFLFSEAKELSEVVVFPDKKLDKRTARQLGYYHLQKSNKVQAGIKGQKLLVGITNQTDGKLHQILSLNFRLANTTSDNEKTKKGTVRICLYGMNQLCNGPGENLLPRDIVLTVDKSKRRLEIDIKDLNIFLPTCGVFVGLEWLGEKGRSSTYNIQPGYEKVLISEGEHLVYYETFSRKIFGSLYEKNKTGIPMFGIRIN